MIFNIVLVVIGIYQIQQLNLFIFLIGWLVIVINAVLFGVNVRTLIKQKHSKFLKGILRIPGDRNGNEP